MMKFKDLPDGKLFQYTPTPGTHETALKVGKQAIVLHTGERIDMHVHRNCDELTPLKGTGYRLGVDADNNVVLFSQANETQIFTYEFLVIGHCLKNRREVRPVMGKREREEFDALVNIILANLDTNHEKAVHLLRVLKDTLFDTQDDIIKQEFDGDS